MQDSEYESFLTFPDLIADYRRAVRQVETEVVGEFQKNNDDLVKIKKAALESERAHRNLLNLCVTPFTEEFQGCRDLGYEFFRASPLAEKNVSNFDFLIARLFPADKPAILILGEAKASVGNPSTVVKMIAKKREIADAASDYILEKYLKQAPHRSVIIESVVAVDSVDSSNMVAAVVDSGEDIKVWHGPSTGQETISLATPPKGTPDYAKYLHKEHKLNSLLERLPSLRRTFDVWPQTHPLIQLGGLLACTRQIENVNVVTLASLEAVIRHDMFYLNDSEREAMAMNTIQKGISIGFLTPTEVPSEYRIVSVGVRTSVLERTLEEKWLKWQLDQDQQKEITARLEKLREEFSKKRKGRKTVEEFS